MAPISAIAIATFFAVAEAGFPQVLEQPWHDPSKAASPAAPGEWKRAQCGPADLVSAFGATIAPPFAGLRGAYPRPLMVRGAAQQDAPGAQFATLHGLWQFEHPRNGSVVPVDPPFGRDLNGSILVPFPPESCLSGVGYLSEGNGTAGFPDFRTLWYRLAAFDNPVAGGAGDTYLLNFEAVDWNCSVWLNSVFLGRHSGGYDAFSFDVSAAIKDVNNELVVFAYDPTEEGYQPQGKQAIKVEAECGSIGNKYVPSSGIWGPVWIERAPPARVDALRLRTNATSVALWATLAGFSPAAAINVSVSLKGAHAADFVFSASDAQPLRFTLPSPETWTAESPTLYDALVTVTDGVLSDTVSTYFGLRSVELGVYERPPSPPIAPLFNTSLGGAAAIGPFALSAGATWRDCEALCAGYSGPENCTGWVFGEPSCGGRNATPTCLLKPIVGVPIAPGATCSTAGKMAVPGGTSARPLLNGEPVHFSGMLDQQWWPDGSLAAPTDDAFDFDLAQAKRLGFNAVRLHTKVANERFYEAADRLGLYVLQDAVQKFEREGFPSDAALTVQFFMSDFRKAVEQKGSHPSIVQYALFNEGDCVSDFDVPSVVAAAEALDGLTSPHGAFGMGRLIDTNSGGPADKLGLGDVHDVHSYPYPAAPVPSATQYAEVGEFSGLGVFVPGHSWREGACYAYQAQPDAQAFTDAVVALIGSLARTRDLVSTAILTQSTDLECECDGLLNYDRTLKLSDEQTAAVAAANAAFLYGP